MPLKRFVGLLVLGLAILSVPSLAETLEDGFYAVVRKETGDKLEPFGKDETRLRYHPMFLDEAERGDKYMIVKNNPHVPMDLKESPNKTADKTDRTQFWLLVSLSDEAAVQLEDFTRQYLGGTVAIVVGGEVITAHGIKSVIKGGKIQISRCGDAGCKVLFRELKDNVKPE